MSVFKTRKSPYYQYDFQRAGRRYHGSTKCLKLADAEAVENAQIERVERNIAALNLAAMLPRHAVREPFGDGWRYYFIVPTKARKAGCPLQNEGLGTAFEAAVARAEDILLPAYDVWCADQRKRADIDVRSQTGKCEPPQTGVYLLLLRGKVVYVGSSRQMPKRVAAHRSGSRPFDDVFYVATDAGERLKLETILIKAINPPQNRKGLVPESVPESSSAQSLSC